MDAGSQNGGHVKSKHARLRGVTPDLSDLTTEVEMDALVAEWAWRGRRHVDRLAARGTPPQIELNGPAIQRKPVDVRASGGFLPSLSADPDWDGECPCCKSAEKDYED